MERRELGRTGLRVSRLGFGAFKIGRNQGIKYPVSYDLPSEREVARLLGGVLDLGINLIDTAPAYGTSEELIGKSIAHRRAEFVLSTKVGETFQHGQSSYDFSKAGVQASIARSLKRLRTESLDLVLIHSDGNDLGILEKSPAVSTLMKLKQSGLIRAVGFSGKTVAGALAALAWADVIMVQYHRGDISHETVMRQAADAGVGVVVKKGLASGHLDPQGAICFVTANSSVNCMIIGGLSLDHMRQNLSYVSQTA